MLRSLSMFAALSALALAWIAKAQDTMPASPAPPPVALRIAVPEARQGAASDGTFVYAIDNDRIGKYRIATGHDRPEVYAIRLPEAGSRLERVTTLGMATPVHTEPRGSGPAAASIATATVDTALTLADAPDILHNLQLSGFKYRRLCLYEMRNGRVRADGRP